MTKVLRASTIIPLSLYVHRDADRQLRRVLEDMGRPGYVLVARQMGKTNLLLNARRELQTPNDAFVYVDLSNSFTSARECFRNVIDTALDSHAITFADAVARVHKIREGDLPAHKEHELELRELLRTVSGKIVIILDEIDALTNSTFSDQVFAQIRSMYFSRANFPDYERLTYVLSGVAEPSELIRNPKLSPFNIGEKIYLDDFSVVEFYGFLNKSRLSITKEVAAQIFEWTKGNPRMTWDVCSEIESLLVEGLPVVPSTVDQVVAKLYLTAYDRAPIDHIRTLAETAPEIRAALVEMRYGKGDQIDDNVRSKLYLAGIIASNGDTPRIKNKIIELSLSDQWLADVERRKLGLRRLADEQFSRGRYEDAIALYSECLAKGALSLDERISVYDGLSSAFYELKQYRKSIEWLEQGRVDKSKRSEFYFAQAYRMGVCHFRLGEFEKSIEAFEEVVASGQNRSRCCWAMLNLASVYYSVDAEKHREAILQLFGRVAAEVDSVDSFTDRERQDIKVRAHYRLSKAYRRLGNLASVVAELEKALVLASRVESAILSYELSSLVHDVSRRRELLRASADAIVAERMVLHLASDEEFLVLSESVLGGMFAAAFEVDEEVSFEVLFRYFIDGGDGKSGGSEFVRPYSLLLESIASKGIHALSNVAIRVVDAAATAGDDASVFSITRLLAYNSRGQKDFAVFASRYAELLGKQSEPRPFDVMDVGILVPLMSWGIREKKLELAKRLLTVADAYRALTPPEYFVFFDYYSMVVSTGFGARGEALQHARQVVRILETRPMPSFFEKGSVDGIRRQAESTIAAWSKSVDYMREHKYQRNARVKVRYGDGRVVVEKYKKVEGDLLAGRCELTD